MRHRLKYGSFARFLGTPPFTIRNEITYQQFSGGRTSALMAALSDERAFLAFENTGRENERTLEFVRLVGEALARPIVWLEFRPPKRRGAPPKEFGFAVVDFRTAARKGEPFEEMMESINAYRDSKGEPPIAPWFNGRICTTHLKHRVLDHYLASIGVDGHERWLGLRADEPDRVRRLGYQETRTKTLRAPLFEVGIRKSDVLEFWAEQSFDLGLLEHEGNCDGCFLKDQADASRAIGERPEAAAWWAKMQRTYPRFGGEKWPSYELLASEFPTRKMIEDKLRAGEKPVNDGRLPPGRFRLVLLQEQARFRNGPARVSCACEASMGGGDESEDVDA